METRRPLLRITNTGISTAVLASGELMPLSPLDREWTGLLDIPYRVYPNETPFEGWGYWIIPGLLAVGLCLALGVAVRRYRR